jgi:hypothetical protein
MQTSGMRKIKSVKPVRRTRMKPLKDGQLWRMAELNLKVESVGKPNAVRIPNSVGGITTIEKFLKKNKAILVRSAKAA